MGIAKTGTVTLPDGRALDYAAESGFGGGLVDRFYRHACSALSSTRITRRSASSSADCCTSRGWERRLNLGRGSGAAYNRLTQAIGSLDELIWELERYDASVC